MVSLHSEILTGQDGANDINRNDIHRFILFVGHEFSDSIRLATELEIEHSFIGDGNPGRCSSRTDVVRNGYKFQPPL